MLTEIEHSMSSGISILYNYEPLSHNFNLHIANTRFFLGKHMQRLAYILNLGHNGSQLCVWVPV